MQEDIRMARTECFIGSRRPISAYFTPDKPAQRLTGARKSLP